MLSKESAELLMQVLSAVNLNVTDPDFEEAVSKFIKAKRELTEIINAEQN